MVVLQHPFQHWLGILKQICHGLELRNAYDAEKPNLHNTHAFQWYCRTAACLLVCHLQKKRDGDCNPKLHMATLSAIEAVASLILCTVHDGIQSVSWLLWNVTTHRTIPWKTQFSYCPRTLRLLQGALHRRQAVKQATYKQLKYASLVARSFRPALSLLVLLLLLSILQNLSV